MSFAPKEIIVGASVPLTNGSSVTFSVAGHIEAERDIDDAVVIFGRKLLRFTNCATDEDRLTVRQVVSSITSTPLDKVPDVGAPTPIPPPATPAKASTPATFDRASPPPKQMPAPPVADAVSRQQHADKLTADLNRLQADHNARVAASKVPPPAEQAAAAVRTCIKPPAAPPKSEASDPYDIVICERCGAETTKAQAKLSQLFMSKTLCKVCMEAP
ncbi:hypothetical protein [Methanoculleus sp. UBA312]|uniref:hypothetical protein n=1 Tax=Methanoculleus sp. UBA312 TaxID=1915499 RepID=UPI0031BAD957